MDKFSSLELDPGVVQKEISEIAKKQVFWFFWVDFGSLLEAIFRVIFGNGFGSQKWNASHKPSGGFHQSNKQEHIMPKNIDELRVLSNPKLSYKGRVISGKSLTQNTSKMGKLYNHRPKSFKEKNKEPAASVQEARTCGESTNNRWPWPTSLVSLSGTTKTGRNARGGCGGSAATS